MLVKHSMCLNENEKSTRVQVCVSVCVLACLCCEVVQCEGACTCSLHVVPLATRQHVYKQLAKVARTH